MINAVDKQYLHSEDLSENKYQKPIHENGLFSSYKKENRLLIQLSFQHTKERIRIDDFDRAAFSFRS